MRLLFLLLVDMGAVWFLSQLMSEGIWFLAGVIIVCVLGVNVFFISRKLYGLRWLSPGLVLLCLMVIAPIIYTVYVAFTNYDNNHVLTEQQAVQVLELETYLDEGAPKYTWTAFRRNVANVSPSGKYALWLKPPSGQGLLALPGEPLQSVQPGTAGVGPLNAEGVPESIEGYQRVSRVDSVIAISELSQIEFGQAPNVIKIKSLDEAAQYKQKYAYDAEHHTVLNQETGKTYAPIEGTFTSADGEKLSPAFFTVVGLRHFINTFTNESYRRPILEIFAWTVTFAIVVVAVQFAIGLVLSVAFMDLPRRIAKIIRSVLLLPYIIPAYLSVLVWSSMFNPNLGIVTKVLNNLFGLPLDWTVYPMGSRIEVLLVTFWLGFPYFLLINSGALQAIPEEILEAAEVDGASGWQRFWSITFPLLMEIVGPLIVLAAAFNFNNFTVVYLLTQGGPPMPNVLTPAGHTDLLITYTYKLAFTFTNSEYGLASVISILIYFVLAPVVYTQFRHRQVWAEETSNA
ncbi:MAG: ABC transporter permease subunit [Chloroflexi bacterium]|nr:ABC transporter permease subunit [Chloroflexota bacterium]